MKRTHFNLQFCAVLLTLCLSSVTFAQTPDWDSLIDAGGSYASDDQRELMQLRQHAETDIASIAESVTQDELPSGAQVLRSTQRGTGPATVHATVYKLEGENRLLSVSVATRNGGGALSLAHSIDPASPNAAARLSDSGAQLLQAAMQGESLETSQRRAKQEDNSPSPATVATSLPRPASAGSRAVETVLFDLDYKYGVGGAAYPVYELVVLFSDGTACQCLEAAIEDINVETVRRESPKRVGSWRRQGGDYQVRYTGVSKPEILKTSVGPPKPLPDSRYLRGKYQSISGGGNTALGGSVLAASVKDLHFFTDGSFAQSNARLMQSNAGVVSGKRGKAGLWVLNGATLQLTYADGTELRTSVYYSAKRKTSADFGQYGVLWIGGEGFKRIE